MSRPTLRRLLVLVLLLPVVPMLWFGLAGIRSLIATDRELCGREAQERFLSRLAEELSRDNEALALPLDLPERIAVQDEPSAEFLADPAILRHRALASRGREVDALEALDPLLRPSAPPEQRIAALFLAASTFRAAGLDERASRLVAAALAVADKGQVPAAVGRWARLRAAGAAADGEVRAWCGEILGRAVDLQELVLLRSLAALRPERADLVPLLVDRSRWPERIREAGHRVVALGAPGRCLLCLRDGWFAANVADGSLRRMTDLAEFAAGFAADGATARLVPPSAAPPAGPTLGGVVRSGDVAFDFGGFAVAFDLPDSRLFGPVDPRVLLGAFVLAYVLLGLLLLAAISRHQRRADELIALQGDLIARVTHELRTPLTVLRMYGESLLEQRVDEASRSLYLETIVAETERLGVLVDRLAAAARGDESAEGGGAADGREALLLAAREFHALAQRDGGAVVLGDVGAAPLRVRCDGDDLRMILDVLADNAVKYGGKPARVRLGLRAAAGVALFTVADSGPGVPSDERPHLFERWMRGSSGRKERSRGAGMGLYLARRAARRNGGDLVLRFPEGGGTIAELRLKVEKEET